MPVAPEIVSVGFGLTVRANVAVLPEQPTELLPVKLYVVVRLGETTMLFEFDAVLHVYVFAPPAVKLTEPPEQTEFVPVMAITGKVFTVTAKLAVLPVHPNEVDPVKLYVVFTVGDTAMLLAFDDVLQV